MAEKKEDITVQDKLVNPDKLVIEARNLLLEKRGYGSNDGIVNTYGPSLSITVTKNNVDRALRIMDVFVKAIKRKGYSIEFEGHICFLVIHGEKIEFYLREKLKRVEVENPKYSWDKYTKVPTGKLAFKVKIWWQISEWEDGKLSLEEKLPDIIASLEVSGNKLKQERIEREARQVAERKKQEIERAKQKRKELELQKFQNLLTASKQWKEAEVLRQYLDAVELYNKNKNESSDEFNAWLLWAKKKADWFDPLVKGKDDFLKNEGDE